ncbi:hypothetical protein B0H14DRAFT_2515559 [Mycena olivaceomarginata]|nr:hypothetical protein B0H14DRAFT_2515559 [Mycena olivaceomarginata]
MGWVSQATTRDAKLLQDGQDLLKTYEHSGDDSDLESAIAYLQTAAFKLTRGHPDFPVLRDNFGYALPTRFERRGEAADLDSAIEVHRATVAAVVNSDRANSFNHLANTLRARFETKGNRADLDSAIQLYYKALESCPNTPQMRGQVLVGLATGFYSREGHRKDPANLDRAVDLLHEALDLWPIVDRNGRNYYCILSNLGAFLSERFEVRGLEGDLDSSIELLERALSMNVPPQNRISSQTNLAESLRLRFDLRSKLEDLERAIRLYREILDGVPTCASHIDHSHIWVRLAHTLRTRSESTGDKGDLDTAIEILRNVLKVLPASHPHRGKALQNITTALIVKYQRCSEPQLIEEVVNACREVAMYIAHSELHESALEAYEFSIALLPQLAMLGLDIHSRHKALTLAVNAGLASDAAACASSRNHQERAVELLEAGRSQKMALVRSQNWESLKMRRVFPIL